MQKKISEMSLDDVLRIQVSQAQDEFYKLDEELRLMVDKLTLVQRKKVNEMVADYISRIGFNQ